jgi:hypothetical protein
MKRIGLLRCGAIGSIIASLKLLDDFDRPLINRHLT